MTVWLTMMAVGLLTYATRLSFILLFGRTSVPPQLQRALRFVPPSVFIAIIVPELLLPEGTWNLALNNPRLVAGLLSALVAWRTRSVAATVVVGMAVLLAMQVVFGTR